MTGYFNAANPAASSFSIASSTACFAFSKSAWASRRAARAPVICCFTFLIVASSGNRNGRRIRSVVKMAGYIEAVVCKSINSQMTGRRRYANNNSPGIPLGVRTAKPEEQIFSACSGSINPVRQRLGRTVEVMTSPGWTIHVARLGAFSPGTTWLVAAPSAARSPISM
jgi:hypothetical protein